MNFRGLDHVVEYLYEPFEHKSGRTVLPHPYIAFDPTESSLE